MVVAPLQMDLKLNRAVRAAALFARTESMGIVILIVLLLLLFGGLPRWSHSKDWGYGPSGLLGLVLAIVLILVLLGHIPRGF
jgi:hypothetical protein